MSYDEHLISMAGGDGEPDALDLDAIQARADAATEGPWSHYGDLGHEVFRATGIEDEEPTIAFDISEEPDANFIAHARTDVPALLALVREQQARIDKARSIADWIRDSYGDYISREIEAQLRDALEPKP